MKVTKRNGELQQFSPEKMKRVIDWACDNKSVYSENLDNEASRKLYNKVTTAVLLDTLITTAANKISLIQPEWQYIAAKLKLLQYYHTHHKGIDFRNGKYPSLKDEAKRMKWYFENGYTDEELLKLDEYVMPKQDQKFTYSGLYYMIDKYAFESGELPQHTYMRVAMWLFQKENKKERLKYVVNLYSMLARHMITLASPIMMNAGRNYAQASSCVLTQVGDDAELIMQASRDAALFSKHKAGLAIDITHLRPKGAKISGNNGISSGVVPFCKIFDSTISAFSQGGARKGACIITFDWTHPEVLDILKLKRNIGTEEQQANNLQYSIRINDYFMNAVKKDKHVHLVFDHEYKLQNLYGKKWEKRYKKLIKKYPTKKIRARDLWYEIMTTRSDTGNLYMFHTDNVNSQTPIDRFINSSNLCQEITQPSRHGGTEQMVAHFGTRITTQRKVQEISLCTLGSVNMALYAKMGEDSRKFVIQTLVRALDNTFEISYYPVHGVRETAMKYRYIGVGMLNYAKMLAENGYTFENGLDFAESIVKSWSENVVAASEELAVERGSFLAQSEKETPRRNALTRAIAPTASSGRTINATESCEPIQDAFVRLEATINLPWIAPEYNKYSKFYEKAFDIDPEVLLKHAGMRQKYLDQSQSVNMYIRDHELRTSAKKLFQLHDKAFREYKLKTLYYYKTRKSTDEVCESCT